MDDNGDYFDPHYEWSDSNGHDPDSHSPTLRRYHQRLWSGRPLPGLDEDQVLRLTPDGDGLLEIALSRRFFETRERLFLKSDAAIPTWSDWSATAWLRTANPPLQAEIDSANKPLYNMGGMVMFPGHRINGQWTINQAKGCLQRISDRLDLTVECIRLHYRGVSDYDTNPLGPTLRRYQDFFDLFGGFTGYVNFWLLQDLVAPDYSRVLFFLEENIEEYDFTTRSPLPSSASDYSTYLRNAMCFVSKRNDRMKADWDATHPAKP